MNASEADVRRSIAEIAKRGTGHFVGPISDALIRMAEARLAVSFPPGYRAFVAALGCGDIGAREFYGLVGEPIDKGPIPNVVWYTLELRRDGLKLSSIPVYEPGEGSIYILDTNDPLENLHVWFPGSSSTEPLGQTFGELLLEALEDS